MEVSKQLKKQIVIEVIALLFLIGVIVYSIFAITKAKENQVVSLDGMVIVIDDTKLEKMEALSDGAGLDRDGATYTITNNNDYNVKYNVVLVPDVHDEDVLKQIRISVDDIYIEDFSSLERLNGGYVITTNVLGPGYTKVHLIKSWYKLDSSSDVTSRDVKFEYRLVKED